MSATFALALTGIVPAPGRRKAGRAARDRSSWGRDVVEIATDSFPRVARISDTAMLYRAGASAPPGRTVGRQTSDRRSHMAPVTTVWVGGSLLTRTRALAARSRKPHSSDGRGLPAVEVPIQPIVHARSQK